MEKHSEIKALPVTLLSGFLVSAQKSSFCESHTYMMWIGKRKDHAPWAYTQIYRPWPQDCRHCQRYGFVSSHPDTLYSKERLTTTDSTSMPHLFRTTRSPGLKKSWSSSKTAAYAALFEVIYSPNLRVWLAHRVWWTMSLLRARGSVSQCKLRRHLRRSLRLLWWSLILSRWIVRGRKREES